MLNFLRISILLYGLVAQFNANAQSKQEYVIYDVLMKMNKGYVPVKKTTLTGFKRVNFENLKEHDFDTKDTLNDDWKSFLRNIDLLKVNTGNLDSAFLSKYPRQSTEKMFLRFSPIIFSENKTKAILTVQLFTGDSSGEDLYLVEKKNDEWVYRRKFFIYID